MRKKLRVNGNAILAVILIVFATAATYGLSRLITTPTDEYTSDFQPVAESGWEVCNGWMTDENYDPVPCREMALWWARANGAKVVGFNFYDFGLPLPPSGDINSPHGGTDQQWYEWGESTVCCHEDIDHFLSHDTSCGIGPGARECLDTAIDCAIELEPSHVEFADLADTSRLAAIPDTTIDRVEFSVDDQSITTLLDEDGNEVVHYTDTDSTFNVSIKSKGVGLAEITARAYVQGELCDIDRATTSFNINPPESCTIDSFSPANPVLSIGEGRSLVANISPDNDFYRVRFSSDNQAVVKVNIPEDSRGPLYETIIEGVSIGSAGITAQASIGPIGCTPLSTTATVVSSTAWWQVRDGDVTSGGDLANSIPGTCSLPVCDPVLIRTISGASGVASAGGRLIGVDTVSENNWVAEGSLYPSNVHFNYDFFRRKLGLDIVPQQLESSTINSGILLNGTANHAGYDLFLYTGTGLDSTLKITGNIDIPVGKKPILFVEDADLFINGNINLADTNSFFMAITNRNIKVSSHVGDTPETDSTADIEGIFVADKQFRTGSFGNGNDRQLHIRGSVAAFGYDSPESGVLLERSLADNSEHPAEVFEFAPDLVLMIPRLLSSRRYEWREVAP